MSCIYEVDSCIFDFEVQKTCLNKKSEFDWQRHIDVINSYKITVLDVGREKERIKDWDLGNLRNLENEEKPTKEIEINNSAIRREPSVIEAKWRKYIQGNTLCANKSNLIRVKEWPLDLAIWR